MKGVEEWKDMNGDWGVDRLGAAELNRICINAHIASLYTRAIIHPCHISLWRTKHNPTSQTILACVSAMSVQGTLTYLDAMGTGWVCVHVQDLAVVLSELVSECVRE